MTGALAVIVADDLTGAADTALGFRLAGAGAAVLLDRTPAALAAAGADTAPVVAIDTGSRAAAPEEARDRVRQTVVAARDAGARHLYLKVDSTLRGHPAAQIRTAADAWGADAASTGAGSTGATVVCAPAFPSTGRTTLAGRVRVHGRSVSDAGFGGAPYGGDVPAMLEDAGIPSARIDLDTVRSRRLGPTMADARRSGTRALVCDAETGADLAAIARAGAQLCPTAGPGPRRRIVWAGSGGLAEHLPTVWRLPLDRPAQPEWSGAGGPVLVVAGSLTEATRRQVEVLSDRGTVTVRVPPTGVATFIADGTAEPALRALRNGRDVVVCLDTPDGKPPSTVDPALVTDLATTLAPYLPLARGLVATGGDTARALLHALGTIGIRLLGAVEPGVPLGITLGVAELPIVTKAGGFGDPQTLERARTTLKGVP